MSVFSLTPCNCSPHSFQLISETSRGEFLRTYRKRFNTYCTGLEFVDKGFFYLYKVSTKTFLFIVFLHFPQQDAVVVQKEDTGGGVGSAQSCPGGRRPEIKTQLEVGMRYWRDLVFDRFKAELAEEIQAVVHRDREGDVADITSANQAVSSYSKMVIDDTGTSTLDLYVEHFEKGFLEQTKTYYTRETNAKVEALSP